MSGLPNGWALVALGELGEYVNGRAFKPSEWRKSGLPIIRIQNLNDPEANFNYSDQAHEEKFKVRNGDLLIAWSASLGTFIWDRGEAWLNQHIFRVEINDRLITKEFLHYAVKQALSELYDKAHGSGMVHVTKPVFESHQVPHPPLNEQRRIVAKLEALLGKVDACQQRLAKLPHLLKRFRQAVLAAACSGKLTADWRENKVEVDSLNSDSFVEPICEIPATWTWTTLNSICDSTRGISYGVIKLGNEVADGVPCLRTSDVKPLRIDSTNVKRISKEISSGYQRTVLNGGEVLVNVRGTLGGVAVVSSEMKGWNISREVALVPVRSSFEPKFISFWIASQYSQNWLAGVEKGAAYTGINLEDLRLLPVAIPSLPEQLEIVRRVEAFFHLADQLEARYHKAKAYVDKLTQSLLAKAFRGDLVPQDPNDEPAAVLLERIKAERATRQSSTAKPAKRAAKARP